MLLLYTVVIRHSPALVCISRSCANKPSMCRHVCSLDPLCAHAAAGAGHGGGPAAGQGPHPGHEGQPGLAGHQVRRAALPLCRHRRSPEAQQVESRCRWGGAVVPDRLAVETLTQQKTAESRVQQLPVVSCLQDAVRLLLNARRSWRTHKDLAVVISVRSSISGLLRAAQAPGWAGGGRRRCC